MTAQKTKRIKQVKQKELHFSQKQKDAIKKLSKEYEVIIPFPNSIKISSKNSDNTLTTIKAEDLLDTIAIFKKSPLLSSVAGIDYLHNPTITEELNFYLFDLYYTIRILHNSNKADTYVVESTTTNEMYNFRTFTVAFCFMQLLAFFEKVSVCTKREKIIIREPESTKTGKIFLDDYLNDEH